MANKKTSDELRAKMAAVTAAGKSLQLNHFTWIIDAAIKYFRESLKNVEMDIVRHAYFAARMEEDNLETSSREMSRHTTMQQLEDRRDAYRLILNFLIALRDVFMQMSAEKSAEEVMDFFQWKRK